MTKKQHSYIAQIYTQGESDKTLITFCAPAEQIKMWGGVPAKTTQHHGGFQRALSDRYKKIMDFFSSGDVSPTSIFVAFKKDVVSLTELGYPGGWKSPESLGWQPKFAHISFHSEDYDDDDIEDLDTQVLAKLVVAELKPRIDSSAENEVSDTEEEEIEEYYDDDEPGDEDGEEESDDDGLDIGQSRLKEFSDFISSPSKIDEWLIEQNKKYSKIKSSSKRSKRDREFLSLTPKQRINGLLVSLLKPAMIVDGQHRVWGAYNADTANEVVFTVCAIKDADWQEQVFQFVVLNKLAKSISSDFLTGLLNTSLTNNEIKDIEPRLERIGIKNTDRVIMRAVNFDPDSPFCGMIAQAGEVLGAESQGHLSGRGAIKIAKRWLNIGAQGKSNKKEFAMFSACLSDKNLKGKQKEWKDGAWKKFFHGFWTTLKALYEPQQVWEKSKGFNLLMIVTMTVLQNYFVTTKSDADATFASYDDFCAQVHTFFKDVPGAFFQGWESTGLQSGDGPDYIEQALKQFKKGSSLKDVRDSSQLFVKMKP